MSRKGIGTILAKKKQTTPLTRCNGTMTESQYLAWIRSTLRSKSLRWPPRNTALELARRPYSGPKKQQKWEYQCAICSEWYKLKDVVVDHFPCEAGSILSVEDIGPFAERLYCEATNLRVLCEWDHRIHTYMSSHEGTDRETTILELRVNDVMKDKKKVLQLLEEHGMIAKNDEQRKQALKIILSKDTTKEK